MFIKHAPYYTIKFPKMQTTIIAHSAESAEKINSILVSADITFQCENESKFIVSQKQEETFDILNKFLKSASESIRNEPLSNLIKMDLKTAQLIKAL